MEQTRNAFAAALAAHNPGELRRAFDACNDETDLARFHRTTLQRWLEGSVPTRAAFIRRLSERLDDPNIYVCWEQVRSKPRTSDYQAVVRTFDQLVDDERDLAFQQIRRAYITNSRQVRSRFSMRITLDEDRTDTNLLRMRASLNWEGRIPENATMVFGTEYSELGDAFDKPECVFREFIDLESDQLDHLLESGGAQIMAYTPLSGTHQAMRRCVGDYAGKGLFRFENPEVDHAQVRISVSYPFPRGGQLYPILFDGYQIEGLAEFSLEIRTPSITEPRGIAFLPAGERRAWAIEALRDDELVMYAGRPGVVLGEGDGVVLSWTERRVG